MRSRGAAAAFVVASLAISAWVAAQTPMGVDYVPDVTAVDTARPQIDALVGLDLARFIHEQSPLGPVSLVVRAPFAALADAGDQLARYRLGSLPCLFALALSALALAAVMRRRGSPLWHCALAAAVTFFTPAADQAPAWGHPEELLATAFVVGSALLADAGRTRWSVVLAALAVATKSWALLALVPIALIGGRHVVRHAALAAAIGAALVAPLAVADAHAFRGAAERANEIAALKPMSVWWRTSGRRVRTYLGGGEARTVRRPKLPDAIQRAIRPAIFALALLLALLAARAGPITLERGFLLLALVFLARCMLDPGDQTYYHVPFVACLAAAEGLRRRPPLLALAASLLISRPALRAVGSDLDAINLLYMAWSIPLAALLAWMLLRPRTAA